MITNLQAATIKHFGSKEQAVAQARRIAWKLFGHALGSGIRNQFLAKLTGNENSLRTLSHQPVVANPMVGTVVVPLNKIVGTEGRSEDFDAEFNPLKKHNRERWISVAVARQIGAILPAVELVQVGNDYYVRDGHHRISVAKALGQLDIDALIVNG